SRKGLEVQILSRADIPGSSGPERQQAGRRPAGRWPPSRRKGKTMFGFGKKEKPAPVKPAAKAPKTPAKAATTVAEPAQHEHEHDHDHAHAHGDLKVKVTERKACAVTMAITVP